MKTSKYKVKIVCGFRQDQEYTIDANEAHKAYYLFNNPEKRGTFDNGLALKGSDIQRIIPDYNATMGWNADHKLTGDDYNVMHSGGVIQKLQGIMALAKGVARSAPTQELSRPLIELREKYGQLGDGSDYAKKILAQ